MISKFILLVLFFYLSYVCITKLNNMGVVYRVKDLNTGRVRKWTLAQVLEEINRNHSEDWIPYGEGDWATGWFEWVEGNGHVTMINFFNLYYSEFAN